MSPSSEPSPTGSNSSQQLDDMTDLDSQRLEAAIAKTINSCPLYAPIFNEQRLRVHSVLDRLRQQDWLEHVPSDRNYQESTP
ncbi:MAG: hypothetical protein AAGN15_23805 [Cyanobacteria bacterium J06581_3]